MIGAEHAPNLVAWLQGQNIVVEAGAGRSRRGDPRRRSEDVILRIDGKFGEHWRGSSRRVVEILHDSSRQDAQIPVAARAAACSRTTTRASARCAWSARGISPTTAQPLRISDRDLATPEARRGQALAFLPYLLILDRLPRRRLPGDRRHRRRARAAIARAAAGDAGGARRDHERQDPRGLRVRRARAWC